MNARNWSAEPWYFNDRSSVQPMISCEITGATVAVLHGEHDKENAARIVACVNALAGIADPAAAIKAAREALEHACDTVPQSGAERMFIEECRRALALLGGK